ncbi:hypothetical protein N658DRAFT_495906 [Parathielavia hyrcaniae]|uniref:RBR-type E3 ubiquitin transferase n=1 Tax=Parathielavia hyrcaniae TaxID=113614 RepID=A0AAN6T236_9PEZI|nr:hypothetical protein N658DRAFT_495906 [Parathielavia hyrcaniae]
MSAASPNPDDLEVALQLQREEVQRLKKAGKGNGRAGEPDDFSLAIQLYEAELELGTLLASDQSMCGSIARAIRLDADLISALVREEEQAAQDRALARRLASPEGGMPTTTMATAPANNNTRASAVPSTSSSDDQLLARLEAFNLSSEEPPAESSAWAATRRPAPSGGTRRGSKQPPPAPPQKIECISCGDNHHPSSISRCPCSHEYCLECLTSLFTAALSDESLFPPRCCGQPIPLDSFRAHHHLPFDLISQFLAKKAELETPDRTYCHAPACSAFIPPRDIAAAAGGDVATCGRCWRTTCVTCKGPSHAGKDCPHDVASQELLRVAAENGWQRCYSCRRLVELDHGCNHITCRCGAQFCYVCGLIWKTCRCEQWNEARLLARVNDILGRDGNARRLNDAERANRLERERQNLVQNHECAHTAWRSRGGSHQCEECYDVLPRYIYECVQCRIMACRRCRFNRL